MAHAGVVDIIVSAFGVFGCVLALAVFFLERGWRGWPKNRRPLCRRCGYLLEGHANPQICPECGSDLARRRAIRIGERRKRKTLLVIGALLLALLAVMCAEVAPIVRRIRWINIEPVWMLRREALNATRSSPATAPIATNSPALTELLRRAARGLLSADQLRRLAVDALDIQGDQQRTWQNGWGELIEKACSADLLDDQQIHRMVKQAYALAPSVASAPRVHAGSPLKINATAAPFRMPFGISRNGLELTATMKVTVRWPDGQVVFRSDPDPAPGPGRTFSGPSGSGNYAATVSSRAVEVPLTAPPGRYAATVECDLSVGWFARRFDGAMGAESETLRQVTTSQIQFEVVASDEPLVKRVADESRRQAITSAIRFDFMNAMTTRAGFIPPGTAILVEQPPMAVAFDIFARSGGHEERLGSLVGLANARGMTQLRVLPGALFPQAKNIDLIFRTNPALAEKWLTITEVWDGEIVIPNVPIAPVPTSTRPAAANGG